jgi:GAF domain-containing protein
MVGTAITTDKPQITLHAETESARYVNPLLPYTRSEIALPLRLGGRAIGALDVQSTQPNAFDEATAVVLQDMADHIAVALGNANLYTQVERRAKQQEGLARVAALAGSTLSVDELLDRLMLEAKQLLGAEITIALLKDDNRQALVGRYISSEDIYRSTPADWLVPLNAPGFQQSIFARSGSYYSSQGMDDPNIIPAYLPYLKTLNVHNFCGVALRVHEQSMGELYVANRPTDFGKDDVTLLQTIATYAANAIQNARLFAETQRRTVREQIIGSVTARMRESLDMDTVLRTAAQEVRQALGLPEVVIRLVPPPGNGHEQSKEALS